MKNIRLTANSWLALSGVGPSALIFKRTSDYLVLSPLKKETVKTKEQIEKKYGILTEKVRGFDENEVSSHLGFPIKHDSIFPLLGEDELPIYSKTKESEIYFVAGYWVVFYEKYSWSVLFCPKLSILDERKTYGPFRTKIEAEIEAKSLNNKMEKK